ncbi:MAG: CTP:molybdopterin cytidylyltransferase MocA [Vicingaceae bacterium]|jgi:CTP:molybdopterin cytidylyltransferase MocA
MKAENKVPLLIILAGGKSSRMEEPKGLLKHNNTFWFLSQVETFIGTEVHLGLGYDSQLYFDAIPWLKDAVQTSIIYKGKKIRVVINLSPEFGLFSTLQSVLKQVDTNQHVFILPVDVPLFNKKEQKKLSNQECLIVIPKYKEKKGHPIKITSEFWQSLLNIDLSDKNARLDYQIKKINPSEISFVEVSDGLCIQNLNTPKDWQAFISD